LDFSWLMIIVCPCGACPVISTSDIIKTFFENKLPTLMAFRMRPVF
jgi:hypothetical protein